MNVLSFSEQHRRQEAARLATAEAWCVRNFGPYEDPALDEFRPLSVSDAERAVFNSYKNGGSDTINSQLRDGVDHGKQRHIDVMTAVVNRFTLREPSVLYRGIDAAALARLAPHGPRPGMTLPLDAGFQSLTQHETHAIDFTVQRYHVTAASNPSPGDERQAGGLLCISLPPGTHCVDMGHVLPEGANGHRPATHVIREDDILDYQTIVESLQRGGTTAPQRHLWSQLDPQSQNRILSLRADEEPLDGQKFDVAQAVCGLITEPTLHDAAAFAGCELDDDTARLLGRGPSALTDAQLRRVNRKLIEFAFADSLRHLDYTSFDDAENELMLARNHGLAIDSVEPGGDRRMPYLRMAGSLV